MLNLLKTVAGVAVLATGAYAAVARPGTVNYAEGQVALAGKTLGATALGSTEVAPGQVLRTADGKAEVLLTPGVFLRLGDQSAIRMISGSITDTRVELLRGQALVEVTDIEKENRVELLDAGARVRLEKKGLYSLNADQPRIAVYDGKAKVLVDDQEVDVKKGRTLALDAPPATGELKPLKFDRDETDELYDWSKLRSEYLARANEASARTIVEYRPAWYAGTGWYWNPAFSTWAFVPGSGLLYSPFGYGFYSPSYWYYNPPVYYYRPHYSRPTAPRVVRPRQAPPVTRTPAARPPATRTPAPVGGSGVRFGGGRGR